MTMSKQRLGLAGIILLMIGIAVWIALPKHRGSSGSVASGPVTEIPVHEAQAQLANSSTKPVMVTSLDLWIRPSAKVAARHLRRTRFAPLRTLGASEQLVDRLTDGDALAVIAELKMKAKRGDPSAANILADFERFLCPLASPGVQEAQSLPGQDGEWLKRALQERIAFNKQFWIACQSINEDEVDRWVAKSAEQGNAASLWLSSFGSNPVAFKQKLVEAVDAGYPDAQQDMAQILTHPPPGLSPGGPNDGEENLFKQAAVGLPSAESALALCEFNGCPGIAINIPAAVSHAREAAQRGAFDAMLEIGPQLQASMIDPDEALAWNLVATMLAQQGCTFGAFSLQWIAAATNTLATEKAFDKVRDLANQYWQQYGSQIMSNIGCVG
jgi:hypothetical protein